MKTKDNEIKPFTAMYQNIDEQEVLVHLPYRMWRLRLKARKKCINKNVTSFNSSTRK